MLEELRDFPREFFKAQLYENEKNQIEYSTIKLEKLTQDFLDYCSYKNLSIKTIKYI